MPKISKRALDKKMKTAAAPGKVKRLATSKEQGIYVDASLNERVANILGWTFTFMPGTGQTKSFYYGLPPGWSEKKPTGGQVLPDFVKEGWPEILLAQKYEVSWDKGFWTVTGGYPRVVETNELLGLAICNVFVALHEREVMLRKEQKIGALRRAGALI